MQLPQITQMESEKLRPASAGAEDSVEMLGREMQRLMMGIRDLRYLGIEQLDDLGPLPKICVVGDQSTGKSSLIEGLSEIKVPRSADTCTRCPLEINLTESADPWQCEIVLVKRYFYNHSNRVARASVRRPLGPWDERAQESRRFTLLTDKAEIGHGLLRAQLATLNPGTSPDVFLAPQLPPDLETPQVEFSPNVVQLNISGPRLPNLSFYDLPGVISQHDDDYVVPLIQNLAREYIKAEESIIMLTVTMNHDVANSVSAGVIKQLNAQNRTVGILTKPDRIATDESVNQWRDILENKRYPLGLGYYIVKNNVDPMVEHSQARAEERDFFRSTHLFQHELAPYQPRFGTLRLRQFLSEQLGKKIRMCLPTINEKINKRDAEVQSRIDALPRPPEGSPSYLVQAQIMEFERGIQKEMEGGSMDHGFFTKWHATAKSFRNKVVYSHPRLSLTDHTEQHAGSLLETASRASPSTPSPGIKRPAPDAESVIDLDADEAEAPRREPKRARLNGVVGSVQRPRQKLPPEAREAHAIAKRFDFESVRKIIDRVNTGLPSSRDTRVTERIFTDSAKHWDQLVEEMLAETERLCGEVMEDCVVTSFKRWESTRLYDRVFEIVGTFLRRIFAEQRAQTKSYLDLEKSSAFTLNKDAKDEHERLYLQELKEKRLQVRRRSALNVNGAQVNVSQAELKRIEEQLQSEVDPMEQELQEMATAKAYYHCAASRLVDTIALRIRVELFGKLSRDVSHGLIKELGIDRDDANQRCSVLLAVDPSIEEERQHLLSEQRTLHEAKKRIAALLAPEDELVNGTNGAASICSSNGSRTIGRFASSLN